MPDSWVERPILYLRSDIVVVDFEPDLSSYSLSLRKRRQNNSSILLDLISSGLVAADMRSAAVRVRVRDGR